MIEDLKKDASIRMGKSLDALKSEFSKMRTGRAHAGLLDHVKVDFYGVETPLNQAANITVVDARTITVSPFDKSMVQAIEKAILTSDLGLNPATSGDVIRVPMPALTEERRRDMVKLVRAEAEAARVAVRNIRRDVNHDFKELLKEKEISEDEERRAQDAVQKLTDKNVAEVDSMLAAKETDLMEV